jgi:multiple sugar transport system substrate-binding protein
MLRSSAMRIATSLKLLTLGLFAALVASCSVASPSTGPADPAGRSDRRQAPRPSAPPPVQISWSFWGDPWQVEINRRVARAFEIENPGIKVELRHRPWPEYFTWLEEQWRAGSPPDVMFLNYIPARAPSGELEALDPYLQRDRFDLSDFYPRLLEQFQYQGHYYGLPRDNDTKVIFYNRVLFEQAGLEPPRSGWTWADLRRTAAQLTRRDANDRPLQYGFAFEADTWWLLFVWQNGGDVVDDPFRPTRIRLGEPQAIEAIQFLADLIHVDRSTPPPDVLLSTDRIRDLFRQGKLAMALGNHALVPAFTEEAGLQWDVVGLPVGRQRANLAGGAGYTMSARSKHKDAAWALLRYLQGPKGQALFAESGVMVPARRSVREDNIFLRQQPYDTRVWTEETEHGRPNLNAPVRAEIVPRIEAALRTVWRGERSAAQAIEAILPELKRAVER